MYQGKLSLDETVFRHKGNRRCPPETRGTFVAGLSISDRPKEAKDRQIFGHWELDSMVSSRGKSKGCFATFVERKSRLYIVLKMSDRSSLSMQKAIEYLYSILPLNAFKTATTDRGKEFSCYKSVKEKLGIDMGRFFSGFNNWFDNVKNNYTGKVGWCIGHGLLKFAITDTAANINGNYYFSFMIFQMTRKV